MTRKLPRVANLSRCRSLTRLVHAIDWVTMQPRPYRQKPAPLKHCEECGAALTRKRFSSGRLECLQAFGRRKFCDQKCMAAAFDSRPVKSNPSWATAHHHARKACPPGPCESCGSSQNVDVHHRNGDWQDNTPSNLQRLCRSCHNREHRGRSCRLCGEPHKALGYCEKHYQRFKKWGDPLMVKPNQHAPAHRET